MTTNVKFWDLELHITHSQKSLDLLNINATAPHLEKIPLFMFAGPTLEAAKQRALEKYRRHYPFCELSVIHKPFRQEAHDEIYQEYLDWEAEHGDTYNPYE